MYLIHEGYELSYKQIKLLQVNLETWYYVAIIKV